MKRRWDVIGVGRAVYDRAVLLPKYPEADEKTEAVDRFEGAGSPVPNALAQLAVWGRRTKLVAHIGDDAEGERVVEDNASLGVDVADVRRLPGRRTPRAYLWVEQGSGRRTVVLDRDIAPLSPADLPLAELERCRALLIDGWEADAALAAARAVRAAGGLVVLDAGNIRPRTDEQLAVADVIAVPVAFARTYYGSRDLFDVARDLRGRGAEFAVVTNGAGGCVAAWGDEVLWMPAYPAEVVDTTGAGDIFHAGLLHGLLNGWPHEATVRWASAAASLAVRALGGRGKLAGAEEVADLLRRHGETVENGSPDAQKDD